jgi:hypothetical protein
MLKIPNFCDQNEGNKCGSNWAPNMPLEKFLKCKYISQNSSYFLFKVVMYELCPKLGLGIKMAVWFPNTKTQKIWGQMTFELNMNYGVR